MTKAEQYRARARECEINAHNVLDLEVKQQYLDLAEQWRQLADWADRDGYK